MDIKETQMIAPRHQKTSGIQDIKLLSMEKGHSSFESPADAIIVRGVKIKIKDLYGDDRDPAELKVRQNCRFTDTEVGV